MDLTDASAIVGAGGFGAATVRRLAPRRTSPGLKSSSRLSVFSAE